MRQPNHQFKLFLCTVILAVPILACESTPEPTPPPSREESIPAGAAKITPEMDVYPPILHSNEWLEPMPLGSPINTAGAEDSPFITPDGNTFYFFFTPDPNVPVEKQVIDGVTGIYVSQRQEGQWQVPQKMILQNSGEDALDGCPFVLENIFWFCSARAGNYRDVDLWTAEYQDGTWTGWQNAGEQLNVQYEVGEMHLGADGTELYFHSPREGGKGGYDLWVSRRANGEWGAPENLEILNTTETEGWPFVTQDGSELWFTRFHQGSPAIFRSVKVNGSWSEPELILSQFAAEPSLDSAGNLYFAHHFFRDGVMLEADIYVAYKK